MRPFGFKSKKKQNNISKPATVNSLDVKLKKKKQIQLPLKEIKEEFEHTETIVEPPVKKSRPTH